MITPELKAIYAGNTAQRCLDTLQFSHPEWSNDFYFVNDVQNWQFQLSTGVYQEFLAMPFELKLPDKNTGGSQELSISLCNIGQEMMQAIEEAIANPEPIAVFLRVFLDVADSLPQNSPPLVLAINDIDVEVSTVTATASRYDVVNRPFPSRYYTTHEFPGLRR